MSRVRLLVTLLAVVIVLGVSTFSSAAQKKGTKKGRKAAAAEKKADAEKKEVTTEKPEASTAHKEAAADSKSNSGEWAQWRGPNRDGRSLETGLLERWPKGGPPLAWKASGLGAGYSTVAVSGGKIFTIGKREDGTSLIALDAKDGKELWATLVGGDEPNSMPTVDGDLVYALGKYGELLCAETATGKEVWRADFQKDFGGKMMSHWGYSESPLVDGDRLIVTPGAPDAMIAALNKKTGEVIWKSEVPEEIGSAGAGYSSIVISQAAGVKQYVQLVGKALISVAAADGKFLWSYDKIANQTANIPTPIVSENYVFASSGYGAGSALLEITKEGDEVIATEVYHLNAKKLQNHHGGMILVDGYVYGGKGHNEGDPFCLELASGKIEWSKRQEPGEGSAAFVYADGNFYIRFQNGTICLIEATPDKYILKGKFFIEAQGGDSWPHPVIAGKKLYLREGADLYCYDVAAN